MIQISTLRFAWREKGPALRDAWAHIVRYRERADELVSAQSGLVAFVSSINGTFTRPASGPVVRSSVDIFPAVSYWIIHRECDLPFLDCKAVLEEEFKGQYFEM